MRSSAGIVVFVGEKADPEHRIKVGRSFQRFALQATGLGIRTAHVNQPVDVPSVRPEFARWLGMRDARPDLVIRFCSSRSRSDPVKGLTTSMHQPMMLRHSGRPSRSKAACDRSQVDVGNRNGRSESNSDHRLTCLDNGADPGSVRMAPSD